MSEPPFIWLLGSTPRDANSSMLGKYKRDGVSQGDPMYALEADPSVKLHHTRGRWWIGRQPGKWSGAMYCEDDAKSPVDITGEWLVYTGSWEPAPELKCTAVDPLAGAADSLYVIGKTPEDINTSALGRFERTKQQVNSRFVYQGPDGVKLFFAFGYWWIGRKLPSGTGAGGVFRAASSAWVPEGLEIWEVAGSSGFSAAPDVRSVLDVPLPPDPRADGKYIDSEFPPERESIGRAKDWAAADQVDCWLRAPADDLFDKIGPEGLLQGAIGDCWLLAALACVSEFPELIESLFLEDGRSEDGSYTVRFFDAVANDWASVQIDDCIPSQWRYGDPLMVFSQPSGGAAWSKLAVLAVPRLATTGSSDGIRRLDEAALRVHEKMPITRGECWVSLLEKAMAKFCGDYAVLNGGGAPAWAFLTLLGPERVDVYLRFDERGRQGGNHETGGKMSWRACTLDPEHLAQSGTPRTPTPPLWGRPDDTRTPEEVWRLIVECDVARHVMTCGGVEKPREEPDGVATPQGRELFGNEHVRHDQLVTDHSYSLLRAVEVGGFRLLQLRNPWGSDAEWGGDWGDASPKWQEHPEVAQAVGFAPGDDGTFFMAFEDWSDLFTSVAVCSTDRAFAKARADGTFAASRAGRGKQAGDFGRVKKPNKTDKRLAKRREVVEAVTAAAAAERPTEQLVEVEVEMAADTAGSAAEGDAGGGATATAAGSENGAAAPAVPRPAPVQVEPTGAKKGSAACTVL